MQERDTKTGKVENHEPETHSTHLRGLIKVHKEGAPSNPW